MKSYIGSKIILAEPEEKDGQEGYRVIYPDGYESWSPKDVFENAYREVTEGEFDLIVDSVSEELTKADIASLVDMTEEDWVATLDIVDDDEEDV